MDVFVYGTLTEPARVSALLESYAFVGAATLTGLRVVEGRYPTLAPPAAVSGEPSGVASAGDGAGRTSGDGTRGADADGTGTTSGDGRDAVGHNSVGSGRDAAPDAAVGGRLLRTDEVAALDRYEGVDDGLYARVSVPLVGPDGGSEGEVAVYVGDPGRLGADATWPGEGSLAGRVRRGVDALGVRVERRPER